MAEHSWPPSEPDLEAALRNLGPHVPYPPTPPIAASVRQRLAARVVDREAGAPRTRRSLTQRAPVGVARRVAAALVLAALVLGGTVLTVSADARAAFARWLGVSGVVIAPHPPSPAPPHSGPPLHLGRRLSLAAARARVRYPILLPTSPDLRTPDEVYLRTPPSGGEVALVYRARRGLPRTATTGVGLLLTEFRADIQTETLFGKALQPGPGAHLELVSVNGTTGYWITGAPHYRGACPRYGAVSASPWGPHQPLRKAW
jgi:hypothetical protein